MFEPYPPFQTSLIKLVPASKYQSNWDWKLTLDKPASIELAVRGLLLSDSARCVLNHSRFAHGDGLTIQSRSQEPYPHTANLGNNLLPHPGMLLSEDGDLTPLKQLFRKG